MTVSRGYYDHQFVPQQLDIREYDVAFDDHFSVDESIGERIVMQIFFGYIKVKVINNEHSFGPPSFTFDFHIFGES